MNTFIRLCLASLGTLGVLGVAPGGPSSANDSCGTGIVTAVTPVGGSCSDFTPAQGGGPDNYEVEEGGTYTMTITGVTECSGDTITIFVQSSSSGNFCFNATGGSGTYSGTFTMPNPACNTMPISYKCDANATCSHPGSLAANGPSLNCKVHLRASNFDANCNRTGTDEDCEAPPATGACCLADGSCVEVTADECDAQGGTYNGDNSLCSGVTCLQPRGACCLVDGSCVEVTEEECLAMGGLYNGDSSLCVDIDCDGGNPCPPGSSIVLGSPCGGTLAVTVPIPGGPSTVSYDGSIPGGVLMIAMSAPGGTPFPFRGCTIFLANPPRLLGTFATDGNGDFQQTFTVPASHGCGDQAVLQAFVFGPQGAGAVEISNGVLVTMGS